MSEFQPKPHWQTVCEIVKCPSVAFHLHFGFSNVFTFKKVGCRVFVTFWLQIGKREFRFSVRRWSGHPV